MTIQDKIKRLRKKINSAGPLPWYQKPTNAGTGIFSADGESVAWENDMGPESADILLDSLNSSPEILDFCEDAIKLINSLKSGPFFTEPRSNLPEFEGDRAAFKIKYGLYKTEQSDSKKEGE